ncbi:G-protein coupled receptor [Dirofilaria immitis]
MLLTFEEQLNWSQCMQIWEIIRVEEAMHNNSVGASHQLMKQENIYAVVHMMLIFWVPATIVLVYCLHRIVVFNAVINPYLNSLFGDFLQLRRTDPN